MIIDINVMYSNKHSCRISDTDNKQKNLWTISPIITESVPSLAFRVIFLVNLFKWFSVELFSATRWLYCTQSYFFCGQVCNDSHHCFDSSLNPTTTHSLRKNHFIYSASFFCPSDHLFFEACNALIFPIAHPVRPPGSLLISHPLFG